MEDLSYDDTLAIQEKVVSLRDRLRSIVSYRDDSGHRKLDQIYFLSGEVAAYKLLNQWYKAMLRNEEFISKESIHSLESIEALLDYAADDFSAEEVEEGYETHSQLLWYDVFQAQYDQSIVDINKEIIRLFLLLQAFCELVFGDEVLYEWIDDSEAADDAFMGEIYSLTHAMIMKLGSDLVSLVLESMKDTKLYKMHFDMFQ